MGPYGSGFCMNYFFFLAGDRTCYWQSPSRGIRPSGFICRSNSRDAPPAAPSSQFSVITASYTTTSTGPRAHWRTAGRVYQNVPQLGQRSDIVSLPGESGESGGNRHWPSAAQWRKLNNTEHVIIPIMPYHKAWALGNLSWCFSGPSSPKFICCFNTSDIEFILHLKDTLICKVKHHTLTTTQSIAFQELYHIHSSLKNSQS